MQLFSAVYRLELIVPATGWRLKTKVVASAEGRKDAKIASHVDYRFAGSARNITSLVGEWGRGNGEGNGRTEVCHVAQFTGINYREPARADDARAVP